MHSDPQQLVQWVTRVAQNYNETCSKCGLTLNFAPGKSKAMVALRGKGSPLASEQAEAGLKIGPDCTLSVVRQYRHVGTLCADTGTHMPDIRKHCKSATQACMELAGTLHARSAIPRVDRVRGAGSMVFSRLLVNGHVWDPLPHGALQALNTVQCIILRPTIGVALMPLFPMTPCASLCSWSPCQHCSERVDFVMLRGWREMELRSFSCRFFRTLVALLPLLG